MASRSSVIIMENFIRVCSIFDTNPFINSEKSYDDTVNDIIDDMKSYYNDITFIEKYPTNIFNTFVACNYYLTEMYLKIYINLFPEEVNNLCESAILVACKCNNYKIFDLLMQIYDVNYTVVEDINNTPLSISIYLSKEIDNSNILDYLIKFVDRNYIGLILECNWQLIYKYNLIHLFDNELFIQQYNKITSDKLMFELIQKINYISDGLIIQCLKYCLINSIEYLLPKINFEYDVMKYFSTMNNMYFSKLDFNKKFDIINYFYSKIKEEDKFKVVLSLMLNLYEVIFKTLYHTTTCIQEKHIKEEQYSDKFNIGFDKIDLEQIIYNKSDKVYINIKYLFENNIKIYSIRNQSNIPLIYSPSETNSLKVFEINSIEDIKKLVYNIK